jgi:hypothetical protein
MKNNEILIESFYSSPFEEKSELKLQGQTIGYMSKELNDELIENIGDNRFLSSTSKNKLISEIKSKEILPTYSNKNWIVEIFDTFTKTFFGSSGYIVGFFDGKRIVIMTTNLRNLWGYITQKEMYNILVHEYQHKLSNQKSSYGNDTLVKKTLKSWYEYFISDYFDNLSSKTKNSLLKFWTNISGEYNQKDIGTYIHKRYESLEKIKKSFELHENKENLEKFEKLLKYVVDVYNDDMPDDFNPHKSGLKSYKHLGIKSNTYIFQEFVVSSEVLAVTFSNDPSKGNQVIGKFL